MQLLSEHARLLAAVRLRRRTSPMLVAEYAVGALITASSPGSSQPTLDLVLERLQRRQKSLRFAWMLLGWLALVIVALAGWTAVTRSRIAAECADLARIRAELLADEQRPGSPPALLRLSRGTGIG